jgi:hypothetical protein
VQRPDPGRHFAFLDSSVDGDDFVRLVADGASDNVQGLLIDLEMIDFAVA